MTRTVRLLPLLFLTFVMPLQAQEQESDDHIQLGGIELTLGMLQEEALQKLSSVYDLNYRDPSAGWFVQRRGGPPFEIVGIVGFTNNRLTFANALWGPNNQTAQDLATWGYSLYSSPYYRLWWRFFFRPRIPLTIAA